MTRTDHVAIKKMYCLKHTAELVAVAMLHRHLFIVPKAMAAVQMWEQRRCHRSSRNEMVTKESVAVAVVATAVGSNEVMIRSGSEGGGSERGCC